MYSRNGHYFKLISGEAKIPEIPAIPAIPANIFMTWKTLDLPPYMKKNVDKLKTDNPEFKVTVFDDAMCRQFITDHFPFFVLDAYDTLVPGAYKADLWRLCVLYIHGGIYLDIKYGCVADFKLSELLYKEHLVLDRPGFWEKDKYGIYNAVMVCLPNTQFLRKAIDMLCWNVQNKIYGNNAMYPTGPGLLGTVHNNTEILDIDMAMILNGQDNYGGMYAVVYDHRVILETYAEYREEAVSNGPNYVKYFLARKIYALNLNNKSSIYSPEGIYNKLVQSQVVGIRGRFQYVQYTNVQYTNISSTNSLNIPAIVYLTWETTTHMPDNMYKNLENTIKTNLDMKFELFSDEMCLSFIQKKCSAEVLHAYNCLVPGAYKADLWRYCILYTYGGIYMDIKLTPQIQLSKLLTKEHYVFDIANHHRDTPDAYGLYNGLMICKAGNQILKAAIDAVVKNVNTQYYGVSALCPTGPNLLGKVYAENKGDVGVIDMALSIFSGSEQILYNNKVGFTVYSQYRDEQKMSSTKQHYSQLYLNRKIYTHISS